MRSMRAEASAAGAAPGAVVTGVTGAGVVAAPVDAPLRQPPTERAAAARPLDFRNSRRVVIRW
jgi:hypothetical protein